MRDSQHLTRAEGIVTSLTFPCLFLPLLSLSFARVATRSAASGANCAFLTPKYMRSPVVLVFVVVDLSSSSHALVHVSCRDHLCCRRPVVEKTPGHETFFHSAPASFIPVLARVARMSEERAALTTRSPLPGFSALRLGPVNDCHWYPNGGTSVNSETRLNSQLLVFSGAGMASFMTTAAPTRYPCASKRSRRHRRRRAGRSCLLLEPCASARSTTSMQRLSLLSLRRSQQSMPPAMQSCVLSASWNSHHTIAPRA